MYHLNKITLEVFLYYLLKSRNIINIKEYLNKLAGKKINFRNTISILLLALKVEDENNEIFFKLFNKLMTINNRTIINFLNFWKNKVRISEYDFLKLFYYNSNDGLNWDEVDEEQKTIFEYGYEHLKIKAIKQLLTYYFLNYFDDINKKQKILEFYYDFMKYLNLLLTFDVSANDIIYIHKLFIHYGIDINTTDSLGNTFLQKVLNMDKYSFEKKQNLLKYALSCNHDIFWSNEKGESAMKLSAIYDIRFLDIFFKSPNVINQLLNRKLDIYIYLYYKDKIMNIDTTTTTTTITAVDNDIDIDTDTDHKVSNIKVESSLDIPNIIKNVENTLANRHLYEIILNNQEIDVDLLLILSILYDNGNNIITKEFIENPQAFQTIKGETNHNWYAFNFACKHGNVDIVNAFLSLNANINIHNKQNRTPLYIAFNSNHKEIFQLLLNHYGVLANTINESLLLACKEKNYDVVKLLLSKNANVNILDNDDQRKTPLIIACNNNDIKLVKILLEAGANTDIKDHDGNLPLVIACHKVNIPMMEELLKHGANINGFDDKRRTPLIWACLKKNLEMVQFLLRYPAININYKCFNGNTPLIIACFNHRLDIAQELLNQKTIQINLTNMRKNTPLITAAECGDIEIVRELLNRNASINDSNKFGNTALMASIDKDHTDVALLLLEHQVIITNRNRDGETALFIACKRNNLRLVEALVEHNADINGRNSNLKSVLMQACENQNMELIQFLIDHQADVNKTYGTWNETAFMTACKIDNIEIMKYLLNYNVDVNLTSWHGKNSLMYLCENGLYDQVQLIIDQITDINAKDRNDNTALLLACKNNHLRVINFLMQHGIEVNTKNKEGNNLLHLACMNGNIELINILSNYPIDVNSKNKDGDTPLLVAARQDNIDVFTSLISLNPGIDCLVRNDKSESAFEIIINQNKLDKLKILIDFDKERRCLLHSIEDFLNLKYNNQDDHELDLSKRMIEITKLLFQYLSYDKDYVFKEDMLFVYIKANLNDEVQYILEHKNECNINSVDPVTGFSCLIIATYNNNINIVKLLLERGVSVNQYTPVNHETPLIIASANGYEKVLECILDYTPYIEETNADGKTALILASEYNYIRCVNILLMHYADPNHVDSNSYAPLHYACSNGNIQMMECLFRFNANPTLKTNQGRTLLMIASIIGNDDIVKYLLKRGIEDINELDNDFNTALIHAGIHNQFNIVNILLFYNADTTITNSEGKTIFSYIKNQSKYDKLFKSYHLK